MCPMVDTRELMDVRGVAQLLRLAHPNSVSTYQRRYPDMPRPVLELSGGRSRLWLRPQMMKWLRRRKSALGQGKEEHR